MTELSDRYEIGRVVSDLIKDNSQHADTRTNLTTDLCEAYQV